MTDDPRVRQLLDELLDSQATPEDVCGTCPELLPELRAQWRQLCRVRAELDVLFPAPPEPGTRPLGLPQERAALPVVPGYEVEALLGRGGMGVVFQARHLALKRTVALKMLAADHGHPTDRARFKAEAEAVARLQHPNIVQIHEVGEAHGRPFIALEFVGGGSLAKRLAGQPLRPHDAARLVGALADAMHLAHSRNLVHRDLKPANVLLAGEVHSPISQCQPKVTDFGLARQLDVDSGQTWVGLVMGTPSYMAPEQAEGRAHAAGPAADVYALGAILYECLTGRPPFQGATRLETLELVRTHEPAALASLNRQTPRDLETICLKCLRKPPEQRYSSARELADDLGRFLRGEPVAARPVGVAERVRKWVWRRPAAAGLLTAVALLVAAGGAGAWLLYEQRAATRVRQAQTDQEIRGVLMRARGLLEDGWQAADLAKLTEARAEGNRAADIARSGGASAVMQQEAEAFREDAIGRLERAEKNRTLREAVLDVSAPQELEAYSRDESGRMIALSQPSLGEQYAAAFRRWGLDVDSTAEAEVVARLDAEPGVVVEELIAALDVWMMERRRQKRPEGEWRRLYRVAGRLDRSERHRQLRALLVGESLPRPESVAGLVGSGSSWPTLWGLARVHACRQLRELQIHIDPRTEPVLTVTLLAQALTEVGDAAGAEQVLRRAATARPTQVVLLGTLAKLLDEQGPSRLEEAIAYYRMVRGQRPHLGFALCKALLRARRVAEAEEVAQELLPRLANNPAYQTLLGMAAYLRKNDREAEAASRKAIALKPDYGQAHYLLGLVLHRQEKLTEAEAAFRKAVVLIPNLASAHFDLGCVLRDENKQAEAEAAFRKAIALKPDYDEAHYDLGNALSNQGKLVEAEAAYRMAVNLKPNFANAYYNLGNVLLAQQKYDQAKRSYAKAIDLTPDFAEAHVNFGNALRGQGKHREAETAYRQAIVLKPDLPQAHYNLSLALLDQQSYTAAEAASRKAIDLKPEDAGAHYHLGLALYRQHKYDQAEATYRKAVELKPDYAEAHNNLGCLLKEQCRFGEAARSLKKAGELFPATNPHRQTARQLQHECERYAILDARLPAILGGTEKPANAAMQMELARLCHFKKAYAAEARFFRDAFNAEPKLAEDVTEGTRYDAACAAALAGCGRGRDADKLDDTERSRWRRQALDWLGQDLIWWGKELNKGNAQTNASVRACMRHWQTDVDLAGLREPSALDKLSPAERQECLALWKEVAAVLSRAQTTK
jgi:serine/threonine-protein kinase